MEKKRKIIRQLNLLILFLCILFFILDKKIIGNLLLVCFLFGNTVRLVLNKAKKMKHFEQRAYLFSFLIILFFGILGMRLAQIQIVKYEKFSGLATQQSYGKYYLSGKRGKILDSTGKELAYDSDIYAVIVDPKRFYLLESKDQIITEIRDIKPFTVSDFEFRLKDNFERNKRYIKIIKKINEIEKDKIDKVLKKYKIKSNEIYFEKSTKRKYFSYHELSPIIGFMGAFSSEEHRKIGAYGIERYYDRYLKGNKIERRGYYANFRNILLPIGKKEDESIETDGNNVQLTIDYYIQYILDDEMQKEFEKVEPKSAVGIIMEPSTGKILAMSSYPREKNIGFLNNRAIRSQYEVGSIFKPLVMAAAYERGIVSDKTRLKNEKGYIVRYGHKIRDSDKESIGMMTPKLILRHSSNVGMSLIAEKFKPEEFEQSLRDLNLYSKTGIDTFGELAPRQLPHEKWNGMTKYTMSFGQGIAITPLQHIAAISSIVNGGIYYKPYIVDNIKTSKGVTIRQNIPTPVRRVVSEAVSKKIRMMLKDVAENGTGKNARVPGYSIGGKTGTAQISGRGGYLRHEYTSSFVGTFPAENPDYVILIMFEKPKADHYWQKFGAWVAAPVFKKTLDRILKYKGITPKNIATLEKIKKKKSKNKDLKIDLLPDFRETGLRLALALASKYDIEIEIKGEGQVVSQTPKEGVPIEDVKKIEIKLR